MFFYVFSWLVFVIVLCADCDCAVWREAIQLSTSGPGKVDVVCFPRAGRACLGTGNMQICFSLFLFSHCACFLALILVHHLLNFFSSVLEACQLAF